MSNTYYFADTHIFTTRSDAPTINIKPGPGEILNIDDLTVGDLIVNGNLDTNVIRALNDEDTTYIWANAGTCNIGSDSTNSAETLNVGYPLTSTQLRTEALTFNRVLINANLFSTVFYNSSSDKFVAVGGGNVFKSTDGSTNWESITLSDTDNWARGYYAPSTARSFIFGTVEFGAGSVKLCYSDDLTNWNNASLPSSIHWTSMARSSNLTTNYYVCVGGSTDYTWGNTTSTGNNTVAYSTDGVTWNTVAITAQEWSSVAYSKSHKMFVAVSNGLSLSNTTTFAYSTNGTTWTSGTIQSGSWESVCVSDELKRFVAVSISGIASYSNDGVSWSACTMPSANQWRSVCWSSRLQVFVALSQNGTNRVIYSLDGITFTSVSTQASPWSSVATGNGIIVGVAYINSGVNCVYSAPLLGYTEDVNIGTFSRSDMQINAKDITINAESINTGYMSITSGNQIPSTSSSVGGIVTNSGISINNSTEAVSKTNGGGLTCAGGLSVAKQIYVGGKLNADNIANINSTSSTTASNIIAGSLAIQSTFDAASAVSGGALTVAGGISSAATIFATTYSSTNGCFKLNRYYNASTQAINAATVTNVLLPSNPIAESGKYTYSAGTFTVVGQCRVLICYSLRGTTAGANTYNFYIEHSDNSFQHGQSYCNVSGNDYAASGSAILELEAADTFSVRVYATNAFTLNNAATIPAKVDIYTLN